MNIRLKIIASIFILPILAWLLFSCSNQKDTSLKIEKGHLRLLNIPGQDFLIALDGQWEFYPHRLLSPGDFEDSAEVSSLSRCYIEFPGLWNNLDCDSILSKGQGFATYRLLIENPNKLTNLGLFVKEIMSSYKLFINGQLIASNGSIGSSKESSIPEFLPILTPISSDTTQLELILQVANFHHKSGGVYNTIFLGSFNQLLNKQYKENFYDIFILGSLLIMAFFHLGMFLYMKHDVSPLLFAIFCLSMAIRVLFTSEQTASIIIPQIDWETGFRFEYISFFLAASIFLAFFNNLFPNEMHKKISIVFYSIAGVFILLATFLSIYQMSSLLYFYQITVVFMGVFIIYGLIKAFRKDREGSLIFLLGGLVIFATLINDILYSRGSIRSTELFYTGLFIFIFFQSLVLWMKFSKTIRINHQLSRELSYQRDNLEVLVIERTKEIQLKNEEITSQKENLEALNFHLEQQKEDLQTQSEIMEVVNQRLEEAQNRSEKLLLNILPRNTAEELKQFGKAKTKSFPNVSVMFTDFKDFSRISMQLTPEDLIRELDYCFAAFDRIVLKYRIEKIKTMGDAFMGASGINEENGNHTLALVLAAIEIQRFMENYKTEKTAMKEPYFENRLGIHTGEIISGVVGTTKFSFDIFGDTVNVASRMQSYCEPGKINISDATRKMVEDYFIFNSRGKIEVKNKGELNMYYIEGIKPEYTEPGSIWTPNTSLLKIACPDKF